MNDRSYIIVDNFNQEVKDFDIVVSSTNRLGSPVSELGMYWGTLVLSFNDFENIDSFKALISIKKNILWNVGMYSNIVNRTEVESGLLHGTYKMKNIIKLDVMQDSMMDFRIKILSLMEKGKVTNNVSRKIVSDILKDAKLEGYI